MFSMSLSLVYRQGVVISTCSRGSPRQACSRHWYVPAEDLRRRRLSEAGCDSSAVGKLRQENAYVSNLLLFETAS